MFITLLSSRKHCIVGLPAEKLGAIPNPKKIITELFIFGGNRSGSKPIRGENWKNISVFGKSCDFLGVTLYLIVFCISAGISSYTKGGIVENKFCYSKQNNT